MANEQTGGLPIVDITKANLYGQPSDIQQELLDANEAGLAALQQRYANPNWFNVAAGFAKPQLGGFFASLGSASQALGENLEKQRANELPVAQMRAQNAIMRNQMQQTQYVNRLVAGNTGPVTDELVKEAVARAPDAPATKALVDQLKTQRETQGLERQRIDTERAILTEMRGTGAIDVDTFKQRIKALDDRVIALNTTATKTHPALTAPAAPNAQMSEYDQRMQYGQGRQLAEAATPAAATPAAATPAAATAPATALISPAAAATPSALTAAAAAVSAPAKAFTPLNPKSLSYDNLTPAQHAAINDMFTSSGLRPIMGTESGRASWEQNIAKLQKENPAGLTKFIDAINAQGGLTPTASTAVQTAAVTIAPTTPDDRKTTAEKARKQLMDMPVTPSIARKDIPSGSNATEISNINEANKIAKEQAATQEAVPAAEYQNLQTLVERAPQIKQTFDSADKLFNNQPKAIAVVSNQIRRAGGAAALMDSGVGVSFGQYGAHFKVPVGSALKAGLDEPYQTVQDQLINTAAEAAYWGLRAQNIDVAKMPPEQAKIELLRAMDLSSTPIALHNSIMVNRVHAEQGLQQGSDWSSLADKYRQAGSLLPISDAQKHPLMTTNRSIYAAKLKKQADDNQAAVDAAIAAMKGKK